jgi:hypothetical protein
VIKLRRMRWVGSVACRGEREMPAGFWWGNKKEGDHVGEVGIDGRIIFRE